jgi:hypothetical protein
MNDRSKRAPRAEIFNRLRCLAGVQAESVIVQVVDILRAGQNEQALQTLKAFDATLGGTGLHSMTPGKKLPGVYRALTYVNTSLMQSSPSMLSRHIIQATCAHVEDVLKETVRFGFLAKAFENYPMGRLLRHGFRRNIPDRLYQDLLWLNDRVNVPIKHNYAAPADYPEGEPLDSHLFDLDEALAVYLIARKLVVELEAGV